MAEHKRSGGTGARLLILAALLLGVVCITGCPPQSGGKQEIGKPNKNAELVAQPGGVLRLPLEVAPDDPTLRKLDLSDQRLFALARCIELPLVPEYAVKPDAVGLAARFAADSKLQTYTIELRPLPGHEAEPGYGGTLLIKRWSEVLKQGPAPLQSQLADLIAGAADFMAGKSKSISGLTLAGGVLTVELTRPYTNFMAWASQPGLGVLEQRTIPSTGYGPFVIAAQEGAELVLKPNPQLASGKPLLDELRFVCEPDRVKQLELYRAGKLDAANLSVADAGTVADDPALAPAVQQFKTAAVIHGMFNLTRFPWGDSEFRSKLGLRQAANFALDRETLESDLSGQLAGYGHFLPACMDEFTDPTLLQQPTFSLAPDPDAASKALTAADHEQGGKLIPGMDLGYLKQGILPDMLRPVLRDWEAVSLKLRPFPLSPDELALRITRTTHEIVLREFRPAYAGPDALFYPMLYGPFKGMAGNWQYLKDPEIDRAICALQAAKEDSEAVQRSRDLSAQIERKADAVLIGYATPTVLLRPGLVPAGLTEYDYDASLPHQDFTALGWAKAPAKAAAPGAAGG